MVKREKFPLSRLTLQRGSIGGFLFENRHAGVPRTLFHHIEVPLKAFALPGEQRVKPSFQLDFIELRRRLDLRARRAAGTPVLLSVV